MGADMLDMNRRDDVLSAIREARGIAGAIDGRIAELPAWALAAGGPLGADHVRFQEARDVRAKHEAAVGAIERRLSVGGPVWQGLTPAESDALKAWVNALDVQADVLDSHFPTELSKQMRGLLLFVLGFGSLFAPLFWTEEEPERKPFFPLRFPWPVPGRPPGLAPPAARALVPSAARIPATAVPFRPGGVPGAAPFRPGVPGAAPFRPGTPPTGFPGVPGAAPFQRFARPLGPHQTVYPRFQRAPS
jgi:hypothetical protein